MKGILTTLVVVGIIGSTATAATDTKETKSCASMLKVNKAKINKAFKKFSTYFNEAQDRTRERGYIVALIKYALLAQEHVLLMGPPGNAKSQLANTILAPLTATGPSGKLEKSFFRIQMTPQTQQSETHGPLDFKVLNETGKLARFYDQSMAAAAGVFIDEIFDANKNSRRDILGILNEREISQGQHIYKGKIRSAIAATNRYISEVYEEDGDDGPKALLDRFAFATFVPGDMELVENALAIIKGAGIQQKDMPELTYEDLDTLSENLANVEIPDHVALMLNHIKTQLKSHTEAKERASVDEYMEAKMNGERTKPPYRATKYFSPRTLYKASKMLKTIVLFNWLESGMTRPLVATIEDLAELEKFFTLNGPNDQFLDEMLASTTNPHEMRQLQSIKEERSIFRDIFKSSSEQLNESMSQFPIQEIQTKVLAYTQTGTGDPSTLKTEIIAVMKDILKQPESRLSRQAEMSPTAIGASVALNFLKEALSEVTNQKDAESAINSIEKTIEAEVQQELAALSEKEKQQKIEHEKRYREKIQATKISMAHEARELQRKNHSGPAKTIDKVITSLPTQMTQSSNHRIKRSNTLNDQTVYYTGDERTKPIIYNQSTNAIIDLSDVLNADAIKLLQGSFGRITAVALGTDNTITIAVGNTYLKADLKTGDTIKRGQFVYFNDSTTAHVDKNGIIYLMIPNQKEILVVDDLEKELFTSIYKEGDGHPSHFNALNSSINSDSQTVIAVYDNNTLTVSSPAGVLEFNTSGVKTLAAGVEYFPLQTGSSSSRKLYAIQDTPNSSHFETIVEYDLITKKVTEKPINQGMSKSGRNRDIFSYSETEGNIYFFNKNNSRLGFNGLATPDTDHLEIGSGGVHLQSLHHIEHIKDDIFLIFDRDSGWAIVSLKDTYELTPIEEILKGISDQDAAEYFEGK